MSGTLMNYAPQHPGCKEKQILALYIEDSEKLYTAELNLDIKLCAVLMLSETRRNQHALVKAAPALPAVPNVTLPAAPTSWAPHAFSHRSPAKYAALATRIKEMSLPA